MKIIKEFFSLQPLPQMRNEPWKYENIGLAPTTNLCAAFEKIDFIRNGWKSIARFESDRQIMTMNKTL